MVQPPFDLQQAHRWFAIESNNRAWDLVERGSLSADEVTEMLDNAHAAQMHWRAIGQLINLLRSECLLATAYAKAGHGQTAVFHAERCIQYIEQVGSEQTTFDQAAAHGCASAAYACAGLKDESARHFSQMQTLTTAISDGHDRELFSRLYELPGNSV